MFVDWVPGSVALISPQILLKIQYLGLSKSKGLETQGGGKSSQIYYKKPHTHIHLLKRLYQATKLLIEGCGDIIISEDIISEHFALHLTIILWHNKL